MLSLVRGPLRVLADASGLSWRYVGSMDYDGHPRGRGDGEASSSCQQLAGPSRSYHTCEEVGKGFRVLSVHAKATVGKGAA